MDLLENDLLWLQLAFIPELRPKHIPPLVAYFGDVKNIVTADLLSLTGHGGLPAAAASGIASGAGREKADQELELMQKNQVDFITCASPEYPSLLREIPDPPMVLYYKGTLESWQAPRVAVVGSRKTSAYGTQAAHRLSGDLASAGVCVVSGMAYGIDQAAHNGVLAAGGSTWAVIGSGLGNIYPSRTEKLVERICQKGAILSEFPFSVPPSKSTFPQRNRIVSGMCYCTLVVEAAERSGALITARLALEQNRELLAVPGPIYSKKSFGSNFLIKTGAKLVQHVEDIIDEFPEAVRNSLDFTGAGSSRAELNVEETRVLSTLSVDTPLHIDIIADYLGIKNSELSLILLDMEMKALIKQLPGMEYIKAM